MSEETGEEIKILFTCFPCASSGARFQRVQVLNPPSSGKNIAKGKDVHRKV